MNRRMATLSPKGRGRGRVLLAYIVDGFFAAPDSPLWSSHTHYWESVRMAQAWQARGFTVDVVDNYNYGFFPPSEYDVVIGARMVLERLGRRMANDPVKIFHVDTAHWLFHQQAQYRRLYELQRRRGVTLRERKLIEPNQAIEYCNCATLLGNDFTSGTYGYAEKPIHRVPLSTIRTADWPARKRFEAVRGHFLWLGSRGMVHKGLDLVLEAFAGMPDCRLTVCGPVEAEPDFCDAYRRELFETPNIDTVGWTDVAGATFTELAADCVAIIYPSCSEGQAGSVITCMHQGLIPIVSYQTGVDVEPDYGMVLADASVETIGAAVRALRDESPSTLESMSRNAWEVARRQHTRETFGERYDAIVEDLLDTYAL